jgi:hypothetical protein
MASPFYKATFDTRITSERDTVSDFHTTGRGSRFSTSIGGTVTGMGGDLIIIDDPLKADEALSDNQRNNVNKWYDTALGTRINSPNTGSIIIVMQRLHANDLVAHVQEKDDWEVLSFAAIAEKNETYRVTTHFGSAVFSRKRDEVLHPDFHSRAFLERQRRLMAEYNFAAQYQQNPQPPGGLIVKREWLKFYSPGERPDRFDHVLVGV